MSRTYRRILSNRKRRIARRLDPEKAWRDQPGPMMMARNIHYQMAEESRGINCGGIGAIHLMVNRIGLREEIDRRLHLLKVHLPYHESDHVLNLAYNALLDGVRLQDIELRRNDEAFLDALGAQHIPDPTTSGDFTRRFKQHHIEQLKNGVNAMRVPVDDLLSNWAYMVMTALVWNLKAWFGLLLPNRQRGGEIVRMEFRRFQHSLILVPAQIVRAGRRIIFRIIAYNDWLKDLFAAWERLRCVRVT